MARVTGPDFVALQVRDLEASARFHEQRLGLERVPESPPKAVVFATEPIAFAVREPLVDLEAVDKLGWGVALWLRCDDAQVLQTRSSRRACRSPRSLSTARSAEPSSSWTRKATR